MRLIGPTTRSFALAAFAALAAGDAATALADGAASQATLDSTLVAKSVERELGQRASQLIKRFIPESEFHATAKATPSPDKTRLAPYMPGIATSGAVQALPTEILVAQTASVALDVEMAARYGEKTKRKIADLLMSNLGLSAARGDKINYSTLDIELPPQRSDIEVNLIRVEADLRAQRTAADNSRRERDDLKHEMIAAKAEVSRLERDVKAQEREKQKLELKSAAPAAQAKEKPVSPWRDLAHTLALASAFLIGAILLSFSFRAIGKHFADAARAIVQVFEGRRSEPAAAAAATSDDKQAPAGLQSAANTATPDVLQALVTRQRTELVASLNDSTTGIVLKYLTELLGARATLVQGMAAMELLGQEVAGSLFNRLNPDAQATVVDFMRNGQYGRPKLELMVEAGERLKTRIFGEVLRQSKNVSDMNLGARISALTTEELARLAADIGDELLPRLLSHLDADRVAAFLTVVQTSSPALLAKLPRALLKIPDAAAEPLLDQDLARALQASLAKKPADRYRSFLKFYTDVLEAAEDGVGEVLLTGLMSEPLIAQHLRRHVITFATFFQVARDIQEDVVAALSTKDVAALYAGAVRDAERATLDQLLPDRRREIVIEEAQALAQRGTRHLQAAYKRARQVVCDRLRAIQQDGNLEFTAANAPAEGSNAA